ncbi:peptidoglycan D,D-transpeptidase FtsI family protein [Bacillus inaquosorum]|uniref:peptidoglycan D,D-transpeptidase FtsI family protein n=1 Tax=Bacillus inaquosorum TaxID=483913 RepID=UPI0022832598|nr:penicillin-binding protein 2 [Bacillus inaquosorum]MCY8797827.1 penicillin-binding protein 2 [Bacillus inaquosorum]MCY8853301.1 penicillin-binding protein 2 [Bacillus inaquosorum]MEC0769247.1 penicillin-binding protein 2 [Bacillus inaquosorum]MEC0794791.1 penicillin-binding protein 2 [Bacillus inaquosorum]
MTEIGRETKKKRKGNRAIRMNLFFLAVFFLFTALIFKLGVVQIVEGEQHEEDAKKANAKTAYYPAPRGKMYDRNQKVAVDNQSVPEIVYVSTSSTKTEDKIKTAKRLAALIHIDTEFLKERDLRDYWIASHPKKAAALLKESESNLKGAQAYKLQLERVPNQELKAIQRDDEEMEIAAIYTRFSSGNAYEPQIVKAMNPNESNSNGKNGTLLDEKKSSTQRPKNDLTYDEISIVSEHLEELPGIDIVNDWTRKYPYDKTLYSVFGGVTTPDQGLLSDRKDFYLTRGYANNDRVGKSYIEYQYEDYLNSQKEKVQYVEDNKGNVVSQKTIDKGSRGYDLQLSFDMELQAEVEKIIEEEVRNSRARGNYMLDRAFVVMMDPNNGDILSMAGKKIDLETNKIQDYAIGAFTTQYEMGSAVKGATVLAGYQDGIPHYKYFLDAPMLLGTNLIKKSYTNMGTINELTALQKSSNVYMFNVAMHIAGVTYRPHGSLPADQQDLLKMRNYYSQFGLGVKTGIDLPQESAGMQTTPETVGGLILDLAIGQYDTYTPLQMAQYISVIANGGYRVQPRIVTSIHEPGSKDQLGKAIEHRKPKVLNKINNSESDLKQVQTGMKLVTSSGTAKNTFTEDVSGKTGTAETFYYGTNRNWWGKSTYNLTFVGYYPSKNPKVAFSVVVPSVDDDDKINKIIAKRAIHAYTELEKKHSKK